MAMPTFTMRDLLETGVHFGHHTRRWDPRMKSYIFGVRNNIHILDLQQTVPLLHRALQAVRDTVARGAGCCSSAPNAKLLRGYLKQRPDAANTTSITGGLAA